MSHGKIKPASSSVTDGRHDSEKVPADNNDLEKRAIEALKEEAKRGKQRAEVVGPSGWKRNSAIPNKRFLQRTLLGSVISNSKMRKTGTADFNHHRGQTHRDKRKIISEDNKPSKRVKPDQKL